MDKKIGNSYDYRTLRQIVNANHDRFSSLNFDDSMSLLQKMNTMVEWFKVMLQEYNDWIAYLDDFQEKFDENLYNTTDDILEKWKADGVFDEIINEKLFKDLENLINNVDKSLQDQIDALSPTVFGETFANLTELQTKYPTGKNGIMIVADENSWYYWNDTAWVKGNSLPNSIDYYSLPINKMRFVSSGTANLFNKETAQSGALGSLGTVVKNANFMTSYYIKITRIKEYTTSSNIQTYACYDVNFNLINVYSNYGQAKLTPDENTRYIRITFPVGRLNEFMFVEGALPPQYTPYKDVITKEYIGELNDLNIEENGLSRSKLNFYEKGNNLFDSRDTLIGKYINPDNNNLIANASYNTTNWVEVDETKGEITVTSARTVCFQDVSKNQLQVGLTLTANPSPYTIKIPSGCKYIAVSYQTKYQETFMMNYGSNLLGFQKFGFTDPELFVTSENVVDSASLDIEIPFNLPKINSKELRLYNNQIDYTNTIDYTNGTLTIDGVKLTTNTQTVLTVTKNKGMNEVTKKSINIINKPLVQGGKTTLFIGDSYINGRGASKIVQGVVDLLAVTNVGTLTSTTGVKNEGRSGWTSSDYRKDTIKTGFTNPFYSSVTNDFNFTNYCTVNNFDPTHVIINLGINDVFNARNDSDFEVSLNTLITNLKFIDSNIKLKSTSIKTYYCGVPLPNDNKTKFIEAYADVQSHDRYSKNVYETNKALQNSGLTFIPTNLVVNSVTGMLDAIHPTDETYYTAMAGMIASHLL